MTFLRLGCTSFGGPVAHLGYFEREFVAHRKWLDHATFAECIAVSQLLPGPGSSQTGMLIGWLRAGAPGAVAAWIGFTLPSAALMTAFALALPHADTHAGWLHGLLLVAAAVVASAIATMRTSLAPDLLRVALAVGVAALVLLVPVPIITPTAIALAAAFGAVVLYRRVKTSEPKLDLHVRTRAGIAAWIAFVLTFAALGAWAANGSHAGVLTGTLFRIGSLVFGGGHVVLPLLESQVAATGIVSPETILAGYAAAQAMPGPLFSISSYVGASAFAGSLGVPGAVLGTVAIFAPSFFLLTGIAPFYRRLAANERFRAALAGTNAGVIGLLAAAFVNPIFASAVRSWTDGAVALVAFVIIHYARVPAWIVVILGAFAGFILES
ncbi:MAG: chromate efflux transporter [Candidatus Eremiobacteraeota bacterium]|nr:chromate efflux transporter [Candidatus Eremiobacteraeota bacterium]